MKNEQLPLVSGDVLDETLELTLAELCQACRLSAEEVIELVEEGIVEPQGRTATDWRFQGIYVRRVYRAVRLHRDLGVNWPGAALALDLLEEIEALRARLARYGD
jgi:chaperone modulatory protein CbpM